jgi:small GTP-binding protein
MSKRTQDQMLNASTSLKDSKSEVQVVLTGHFQHGKSTLAKLLAPNSLVECGDGTKPTTHNIVKCPLVSQFITIIDTPGVNGHDDDDVNAKQSLEEADLALLVVMTEKALSSSVLDQFKMVAERRIPTILVLNCLDPSGQERNDPAISAQVCPIIKAIRQQVANLGVRVFQEFLVNLAWAASGSMNDILDKRTRKRVQREYVELFEDDPDMHQAYSRSGFEELRRFLLAPSPSLFTENGFMVNALVGRIQRISAFS